MADFLASISATAVSRPGDVAVSLIEPNSVLDWTSAMHNPLNALRLLALSGSRLLGLPLPTPMILPGPSTSNVTSLSAVGTVLPSESTIFTATSETSSPSAFIVVCRAEALPMSGFRLSRLSSWLRLHLPCSTWRGGLPVSISRPTSRARWVLASFAVDQAADL